MPRGLQPCSSSPIKVREASAESVVLPVPDRPKKIAQSPFGPTLAEQCIGSTSRIGAGIEILHEQFAALQISEHPLLQAVEASRVDRLVDGAPPDRVFRAGLVDDVFVARRAAGMPAGIGDKGAPQSELALPARN